MIKIDHNQLDAWRHEGGQDLVIKKLRELRDLHTGREADLIIEPHLSVELFLQMIEALREKNTNK